MMMQASCNDPLIIPDPVVYLNPAYESLFTKTASDRITAVKNLGTGPDFSSAPSGSERPHWSATNTQDGGGGNTIPHACIEFKGNNQYLVSDSAINTGQDITVFSASIVANSPGSSNHLYGTSTSDGWAVVRIPGKFASSWNLIINGSTVLPNLGLVSLGLAQSWAFRLENNGYQRLVANKGGGIIGALAPSTPTSTSNITDVNQTLYLGANPAETVNCIRHSLYFFALYDRPLTDNQIRAQLARIAGYFGFPTTFNPTVT